MSEFIEMPLPHGGNQYNPTKIVVHAIGEYIDTEERDYTAHAFLAKLGLSAHVLVDTSGRPIRCVPDERIAYHARGHNRGSLGIEILVPGLHNIRSLYREMEKQDWCSEAQIEGAAQVMANWMAIYQIGRPRVYGHSDLDPGRKQDPGAGFPWDRLFERIAAY